ncbi:hypothetical protein EB796_017163 [Bugula neritina]|uniref:Uncharacterized protein n=1 Tax=Bugula neritina TaxID=10212 RepID=A0A7J7JFB5_BUGNE|nr:hypothetical protein EB796_017163 [Bugula neritina]
MAVAKPWIRNSVIASAVVLKIFALAQVGLTAAANILLGLTINSSFEFVCISVLLMPTIWLSFAAAMSRHRGVYITLTVMSSLALMSAIGFLVYEGYVFGILGYYAAVGSVLQGMVVSKIVCWSIITIVLLLLLGFAIAGDCYQIKNKHPPESSHFGQLKASPIPYFPPEYPGHSLFRRSLEPTREYPRMVQPPPITYGNSPRHYYSRY